METNENVLINKVEDFNIGNTIKSGDQTLLKYKILDGDGEILDLAGLPCRAVVKKHGREVYSTTDVTIAADNVAQFRITEVLPADEKKPYMVEFIINEDDKPQIFPSKDTIELYILSSSILEEKAIIQSAGCKTAEEIILKKANPILDGIDEAEATRRTSEDTRVTNELARERSEEDREFEEMLRQLSEVDREYGESTRVAAESNRKATFDELVDTGVLQTNINQKLAESEEEYAPRLTSLEQNDAELTARLAQTNQQKADKVTMEQGLSGKRDKSEPIGLDDADSDLLTAIQGGTTFELLSIPRDESVTPNTISNSVKSAISNSGIKFEYGKNLFDKHKVVPETVLNSSGSLSSSTSSWATSDFEEVPPSTDLVFNKPRFIAEYDMFKNFIPGTYRDINQIETTFKTTPKTKYVRVTFFAPYIDTAKYQLELGSVPTEYRPYTLPKIVKSNGDPISVDFAENTNAMHTIKPNKNIFNKKSVIKDANINVTYGTITPATGVSLSDLIEIEQRPFHINKPRALYEFDKNKNIINFYTSTTIKNYTARLDTKYIRVLAKNEDVDSLQVEYGNVETSYEDFYCSVYYGDVKVFDLKEGGTQLPKEELLQINGYEKFVERNNYEIWKNDEPRGYEVMAIHENIAVRMYRGRIEISTTGINGDYSYHVDFDTENFPNLIHPSGVESILILPYTRNATTAREGADWRIVVITNYGQVYHNFPSRDLDADGASLDGDMLKFDESVIWDLPERKYPSKSKEASGVERYMPGLPDQRYQYFPPINTDNGYGNGGFGKSITRGGTTFPRFYQPGRTVQTNSFSFMGGYESGNKISVIGTYKSNTSEAARICIFVTDDGGRSWYNKYEFATQDYLALSTKIDTTVITENYVENSFALSKRTLVAPSEENKEPINKFSWDTDITISNITKGMSTILTTSRPHGISDKAVVAIKTDNGSSAGFEWLLNNTTSPSSGGNGVLFSVKRLTDTTLELYEYVHSAHNNIQARHIHFVNKVKDGWLFGTGEEYPTGFIFFMKMKEVDAFRNRLAYQDFPVIRLSSSKGAVQRLIGADMFDDTTMLVAVDNETTPRNDVIMPEGRTETFARSSIGIFKGKLADIDDMDNFECVYEAEQVAYFFKKKGGAHIFAGQQGEFAISMDNGDTWLTENVINKLEHFRGESKKYIVIDNFIVILKQ